MKKIIILCSFALCLAGCNPYCRYVRHYKSIVKELSSQKYKGRGYTDDGVRLAGDYIAGEFRRAGADTVLCQPFTIDINTFPGKMEASVGGRSLIPGTDFVMREYSPGVSGDFRLYHIDTLDYNPDKIFEDMARPEFEGCMAVCDFWFTYRHKADFRRLQSEECRNAGLVYTWNTPLKFYKAYGDKVVRKPIIWTTSEAVDGVDSMSFDIENKFLEGYESENIIACVRGERSDSCFVFTAHYDHLGMLGAEVYYPGANDNASGTAAIITLAEYYSKNRPEFDMWFVAFAGEEAGLRGSTAFSENPPMNLSEIRYLVNLDMIGDNNPVQYCEVSDAGKADFRLWEKANEATGSFESLRLGELAANSDHYPFAVLGVPAILFENEKGDVFDFYHTDKDCWDSAVFDTYLPIFRLVTEFVTRK